MPYAINGSFYDIKKEKFIDGLDINNKNQDGKTVLMALAEKGLHNEVVRLIRAGSDWAAQDNNDKTAKDYAYDWCHGGGEDDEEEREWDILSIFEELEKEKNNK
jgi:ankyrin repeat protein